MRAIVKTVSDVELQDLPPPVIHTPDHVMVKIRAAGLCRTDLAVADGTIPVATPRVLGHEFAGIVEETGNSVSGIKPGDHVTAMPFVPRGNCSDMLGLSRDGAFADYICVPASVLYRLPSSMPFTLGAYSEPVAASLAVLQAGIRPEEKGLIYGHNRISDLTLLVLKAHGFKDVVMEKPLTPAQVRERANEYDFIIETLATSETMRDMQEMIRPSGKIILKSRQHRPVAVDINKAVLKETIFHSVNYGDFQRGIDLMASGALQVDHLFGNTYAFDRHREMFAEGRSGEARKLFFVME